jgi:hypothetical protein
MAESHHHLSADSAEAPDRKDVTAPFVCWAIASTSTRRLTTAG